MAKRKKNRVGAPRKDPAKRRIRLVTTVAPSTMVALQRQAKALAKTKRPSLGVVIDRLVITEVTPAVRTLARIRREIESKDRT